jgi:hypothetical protein
VPVVVFVFGEHGRGLVGAALADDGFGVGGGLPGEFLAELEAHSALGVGRGVAGLVEHDEAVGEGEAVAADDAALVAFDDGKVVGPFAMAEVAEDVGHLDVVGVGFGFTHGKAKGKRQKAKVESGKWKARIAR